MMADRIQLTPRTTSVGASERVRKLMREKKDQRRAPFDEFLHKDKQPPKKKLQPGIAAAAAGSLKKPPTQSADDRHNAHAEKSAGRQDAAQTKSIDVRI